MPFATHETGIGSSSAADMTRLLAVPAASPGHFRMCVAAEVMRAKFDSLGAHNGQRLARLLDYNLCRRKQESSGVRLWCDGVRAAHGVSIPRRIARPDPRTPMKDDTVADDEARQATSREAVKSKVESRVNAEISGQAGTASTEGQARVVEVAA